MQPLQNPRLEEIRDETNTWAENAGVGGVERLAGRDPAVGRAPTRIRLSGTAVERAT